MLHGSCMDPAYGREFTHPQNSLLIRFSTWFFWYLKLLETWERKNFRTFHQPPQKTDIICLPLMRGFVMMGLHHRVFHLKGFHHGSTEVFTPRRSRGRSNEVYPKKAKSRMHPNGGLVHLWLGGGFKYYLFSALLGKDSHFDDHIFQKWVGSTTNYMRLFVEHILWGIHEQPPMKLRAIFRPLKSGFSIAPPRRRFISPSNDFQGPIVWVLGEGTPREVEQLAPWKPWWGWKTIRLPKVGMGIYFRA